MLKRLQATDISIPIQLEEALTGNACVHIVTELVKYILLQKQQIPLPYDSLVKLQKSQPKGKNIALMVNFLNTLEHVSANLADQLALDACHIREIVILIGATIFNPKICIRIEVPVDVLNRDTHQDHQHDKRKPLLNIMRTIFMCHEFQDQMSSNLGLTNTFILIHKKDERGTSEFFIPKPQFKIPSQRVATFTIKLSYSDNYSFNCNCKSLVRVHNDSWFTCGYSKNRSKEKSRSNPDPNVPYQWYQSKEILKGFKLM